LALTVITLTGFVAYCRKWEQMAQYSNLFVTCYICAKFGGFITEMHIH